MSTICVLVFCHKVIEVVTFHQKNRRNGKQVDGSSIRNAIPCLLVETLYWFYMSLVHCELR